MAEGGEKVNVWVTGWKEEESVRKVDLGREREREERKREEGERERKVDDGWNTFLTLFQTRCSFSWFAVSISLC